MLQATPKSISAARYALAFIRCDSHGIADYIERAAEPARLSVVRSLVSRLFAAPEPKIKAKSVPRDDGTTMVIPAHSWRVRNHFVAAELRQPNGRPSRDQVSLLASIVYSLRDAALGDVNGIAVLVQLLRGDDLGGFRIELKRLTPGRESHSNSPIRRAIIAALSLVSHAKSGLSQEAWSDISGVTDRSLRTYRRNQSVGRKPPIRFPGGDIVQDRMPAHASR